MNNITLNDDQENAKKEILNWLKEPDNYFYSLIGSAGSGKTTLAKSIIDECKIPRIGIAAPTHAAKRKIQESTGRSASTLQKILGLRLDVTFEDFDINNPKFNPLAQPEISSYKFLIIDEASMINSDLFDLIKEMANRFEVKVLFMGDELQLPPIGEVKSRIFSDIPYSKLTTIVRQGNDNPNSELLLLLREDIENNSKIFEPLYQEFFEKSRGRSRKLKHQEALNRISRMTNLNYSDKALRYLVKTSTTIKDDKGYYVVSKSESSSIIAELFLDTQYEYDSNFVKYLAYTNKNVEGFCSEIRRVLYGKNAEHKLLVNENLIGYNSIVIGSDLILENSNQYTVANIEPKINSHDIKGSFVKLVDVEGKRTNLFIVDKSNYPEFSEKVNELLSVAYKHRSKANWEKFYAFKNSHILLEDAFHLGNKICSKDIHYGYGSTVHKSQGSTYTNSIVNVSNINVNRNIYEKSKLLYVALSRCTHKNVIIL